MIGLSYYENWSEEKVKQDIIDSYCVEPDLVNKFEIIIAHNDGGGYDEASFFLLRNKETKELFENHASHCSCYGFEGQFEPKPTTLTYLRSEHFYVSSYISKEIIQELLKDF